MFDHHIEPVDAEDVYDEVKDCIDSCGAVDTLCIFIDGLIDKIQFLNLKYVVEHNELRNLKNELWNKGRSDENKKHEDRVKDLISVDPEIDEELPFDDEEEDEVVGDLYLEEIYGYDFYRKIAWDGGNPMEFRWYRDNLRMALNGESDEDGQCF